MIFLLRGPLIERAKDYEQQSLDLQDWMRKQKKCASTSGFFQNCDSYLERLKVALNREMEIAAPFDMEAFQQRTDEACIELAELLGSTYPKRLCPEMDCDADDMDDTDDADDGDESRRLDPIYRQLWEAVNSSKAKLYEIARENSLYAVFSCENALFSDKEIKKGPAQFIDELREGSLKHYDFLFGDDYEGFVLSFWQAVKIITDEINRVFVLESLDKGEEMRLEAGAGVGIIHVAPHFVFHGVVCNTVIPGENVDYGSRDSFRGDAHFLKFLENGLNHPQSSSLPYPYTVFLCLQCGQMT